MLLRPFLNDATLVRELPVWLHDHAARWLWSTRTSTWSIATWLPPTRSDIRSWPCSRPMCRQTTCRACPSWWSEPERRRICRPTPASSSLTRRLATVIVVELGNTRVRALATPGHAPAHHAYLVSDLRRGTDEPWLVFTGDSLLIGDVGRPDLHVAGDAAGQARILHGSLQRLLELSDGVGRPARATTADRCVAADCPRIRSPRSDSSARTTRCSPSPTPTRSPGRWSRTCRAARLSRREIVVANRRGSAGAPGMTTPVRLGLRENAAQFSLLVG